MRPDLIGILRALGGHHLKLHEKLYGSERQASGEPVSEAEDKEYWAHPLVWLCRQIEDRTGLDRHKIELVAHRLGTPVGLKPDKSSVGSGDLPDLTWIAPRLQALESDGTTDRLWNRLMAEHRTTLVEAGLNVTLPKDEKGGKPTGHMQQVDDLDDAWLAPAAIALRYPSLSSHTVNSRLRRFRNKNCASRTGWKEATDRKPREPQYLYRLGSVKHLF